MPIPFIAAFLVGIASVALGYLLMPKVKISQLESTKDIDSPTAEAGRPIPVVFGSITIKSANNLGTWDKETIRREV